MMDRNLKQLERIKEDLERRWKDRTFNMVEPYIELMEMIKETNDKIEEFYSKIRLDEDFEGNPYKLKGYDMNCEYK